ncbi:MAG TPA: hypothetical protein VHE35_36225, partial [Kofleriaceae bacterium]|nr:hypothetical protein [Kofleriaceae bacterium]
MTTTEPGSPLSPTARLLEERPFTLEELERRAGELSAPDLVLGLRDGRKVVRANAALGLAVVGYTGRDLVPFLRDSEAIVARAAGLALVHLGRAQRDNLVTIAGALDGARPEVVDLVVRMFSELIGQADAELVGVLDTADRLAAKAMVDACERVGTRGLHLLEHACGDDRVLVRLNAVRGVGRLASLEPVSAIAAMQRLATEDTVADVRATAQVALAAYAARARVEAAARAGQPIPTKVPDLFRRVLTPDELRAAATGARLDELLAAIDDVRVEIRLNAVRIFALQGADAAPAATALALAARDADPTVRRESVVALAALAKAGVDVAAPLVRALGDSDAAA